MLELLSQEVFVELTVKEILWGYENPLIELAKGIFPPEKQFPFDKFGLFVGVIILRAQSFTSLMANFCQYINRVSSFSRCLNGTFP